MKFCKRHSKYDKYNCPVCSSELNERIRKTLQGLTPIPSSKEKQ